MADRLRSRCSGGRTSVPARTILRGLVLGATASAVLSMGASATAGAAGADNGYGSAPTTQFGGSAAVLVARQIGESGGTMSAPVRHAHLDVGVPRGVVSHTAQWIVTVSEHPSLWSAAATVPTGKILLAFAVAGQRHGAKLRTAVPVLVAFTGSQVTGGTHVSTERFGTFTPVRSFVTGHTVTFAVPSGEAVAILGS